MEFDKSRVYTALNADELKIGSKVILADSLDLLKVYVKEDFRPDILKKVAGENFTSRFCNTEASWNLAYLVSEPEEKKLKWTDLKVGDVITEDSITAMVVMIDKEKMTGYHICLGDSTWVPDDKLVSWEKVED